MDPFSLAHQRLFAAPRPPPHRAWERWERAQFDPRDAQPSSAGLAALRQLAAILRRLHPNAEARRREPGPG